jgi:hypothetical protein
MRCRHLHRSEFGMISEQEPGTYPRYRHGNRTRATVKTLNKKHAIRRLLLSDAGE